MVTRSELLDADMCDVQRASQEVKDAQMFREKMGSVQDWMSRVKLPRDLKQKIRAYYAEVGSLAEPGLMQLLR